MEKFEFVCNFRVSGHMKLQKDFLDNTCLGQAHALEKRRVSSTLSHYQHYQLFNLLGVVHNCQHLCISTESNRGGGGSEASVLFLKC